MERYRVSIGGLMAFILCVGVALTALRNADPLWATAAYSLAYFAISSAIVCALVGRGAVRNFSIGFAIFSLSYVLCGLLPDRAVNMFGFGPRQTPQFILETGLVYLRPYLHPPSLLDTTAMTYYDQVGHSLAMLFSGLVGAVLSRFVAERPRRRDASTQ